MVISLITPSKGMVMRISGGLLPLFTTIMLAIALINRARHRYCLNLLTRADSK